MVFLCCLAAFCEKALYFLKPCNQQKSQKTNDETDYQFGSYQRQCMKQIVYLMNIVHKHTSAHKQHGKGSNHCQ